MGLLDDLAGRVASALGANSQYAGLASHVMDYLNSPQSGGLPGLVKAFESAGLGHIAQSWVSTGSNLPVTAEQIQRVLGSAPLQALAARAGISPDQLGAGLSAVLPHVVDLLTPTGRLPQAAK